MGVQERESVAKVCECIRGIYPETRFSERELRELVEESFVAADENYDIQEAVEWGKDFSWPEGIATRDLFKLKKNNYNLPSMVEEEHALMRRDRLSAERIDEWVEREDPDRQRLLDLVVGMRVLTAEDFQPNGRPSPKRKLYLRVKNAVNKMLVDMWERGLVFILPTAEASKIEGLHYHPAHWARKKGKRCGRQIGDLSDQSGGTALNSEEAKRLLEQLYGKIEHPTDAELVNMVLNYAARMKFEFEQRGEIFSWDELVLFKGDLARAFTLLFVRPDGAGLFACELEGGYTLIYHTGFFGWTGTPFAFQVLTRVLERNMRRAGLPGDVRIYVDDFMGVTLRRFLEECKRICYRECRGLLGPHSVAEDKWETSLGTGRIEFIGWLLDLNTRRVTLARRNFMKVLYGFFTTDPGQKQQVRKLETLASWSSRYSMILRQMRPYSTALHQATAGMKSQVCYMTLSEPVWQAIFMWRVMLCLLNFDEAQYARAFDAYSYKTADVDVNFDASLYGVGAKLTDLRNDRLIGVGKAKLPYLIGDDSSFQNTVEFITMVMSCASLAKAGYRGISLRLIGDNTTSLKWGRTERFKGLFSHRAAVVWVLLSIAFDFCVAEDRHVEGELNFEMDGLSRDKSVVEMGFSPDDDLKWEESPEMLDILDLCDPTDTMECLGDVVKLWRTVNSWASVFK